MMAANLSSMVMLELILNTGSSTAVFFCGFFFCVCECVWAYGLCLGFGSFDQESSLSSDTKVGEYRHGYTPRNTRLKGERDKRKEKWKLCKVKNKIG